MIAIKHAERLLLRNATAIEDTHSFAERIVGKGQIGAWIPAFALIGSFTELLSR